MNLESFLNKVFKYMPEVYEKIDSIGAFENAFDNAVRRYVEKHSKDVIYEYFFSENNTSIRRDAIKGYLESDSPGELTYERIYNYILDEIGEIDEELIEDFIALLFSEVIVIKRYEKIIVEIKNSLQNKVNGEAIQEILKIAIEILEKLNKNSTNTIEFENNDNNIEEYFKNICDDFTKKNNQSIIPGVSLKDIYIPMQCERVDHKAEKDTEDAYEHIQKWADNSTGDIMFLLGDPGMGKSSLCKKMVYEYREDKKNKKKVFWFRLNDAVARIVDSGRVFLENAILSIKASKIFEDIYPCRESNKIEDRLQLTFNNDRQRELKKIFSGGIIFLDGYDELYTNLPHTVYEIGDFIGDVTILAQFFGCKIVVTSRKTCFSDLEELEQCAGNVRILSLLSEYQQREWITRYRDFNIENRSTFSVENLDNIDIKIKELAKIPLLFQIIVHTNFQGKAKSKGELYFKLIEAIITRQYNNVEGAPETIVSKKKLTSQINDLGKLAHRIFEYNDDYIVEGNVTETVLLFYFKVLNNAEELLEISFIHRSFYQYFLALHIVGLYNYANNNESAKQFLNALYKRRIDTDVLQFIAEIMEFNKYDKQNTTVIVDSIARTNCITEKVLIEEYEQIKLVNNIFVNAVSIVCTIHNTDEQRLRLKDDERICNLIKTFDCSGIVLSNVEIHTSLYRADLSDADLRRADLSEVNLLEADLSGADLRNADLSEADLVGTDLSKANLSGADLSGADLIGADLSGADLSGADLSGAGLGGVDLSGVDLSGIDLSGAGLGDVDLSGTDLSGADLGGSDLSKAELSGADLSGANLSGANLFEASLKGADLVGADLVGADLSGADLSEADLSKADLSGADLVEADLRGANLNKTNLSGVDLFNATLYRNDLSGAIFTDEDLIGATIKD